MRSKCNLVEKGPKKEACKGKNRTKGKRNILIKWTVKNVKTVQSSWFNIIVICFVLFEKEELVNMCWLVLHINRVCVFSFFSLSFSCFPVSNMFLRWKSFNSFKAGLVKCIFFNSWKWFILKNKGSESVFKSLFCNYKVGNSFGARWSVGGISTAHASLKTLRKYSFCPRKAAAGSAFSRPWWRTTSAHRSVYWGPGAFLIDSKTETPRVTQPSCNGACFPICNSCPG